MSVLWPTFTFAQTGTSPPKNGHPFDIGIIIDNRPLPRSEQARAAFKAEVDDLFKMLDRHMFIEHIMVFERPTIGVICDVFGCPEDAESMNSFLPLIWQITRENEARIVVYYLGEGRIEGLERQLLFKRVDKSPSGDVVPLSVDWLHAMLKEAAPAQAALLLDASFASRRLPCADEDPGLINDALLRARADYQQIPRDRWNRTDNIELSTTTPVRPARCDHIDLPLGEIGPPSFTKLVLKGIVRGEADVDQDRLIDLAELGGYLDDRMKRAARFHWGRLQNVRAIGSASQALAAVDGRRLGERSQAVLARRNQSAEQKKKQDAPAPVAVDDGEKEGASPQNLPSEQRTGCRDGSNAKDCHPCVLDPDGEACVERCRADQYTDLCAPDLTSRTNPSDETKVDMSSGTATVPKATLTSEATLAPETTLVPETDTVRETGAVREAGADGIDMGADGRTVEQGIACRWVAEHIAPFASTLVTRIKGDAAPSCAWAADRTEPELGPIAEILTPVAWRLGRTTSQNTVACLLDCNRLNPATGPSAADQPVSAPNPREQPIRPALVDPRTLDARHRLICDRLHEPLPPYIGLPRWMPGPLIVSESLRAYHGCPPPPAEPELPIPLATAFAPPDDESTPPATQAPDESPAVADADDRLADWPPSAADVDLPSETEAPSATAAPPVTVDPSVMVAPPLSEPKPDVETDAATPIVGGDLEEEPAPAFLATALRVRRLQSALTVDNRNPGPIDGIMGKKTMQAIRSWRRDHERADRTDAITEEEYRAIIEAFAQRFEQVLEKTPSF